MTNYSETIYWLALINQSGLKLNLIKPIIQRWCITYKRPLANLFTLSQLELTATFGLSDNDAQQLLNTTTQLENVSQTVTRWQTQGIHVIICIDPRYPQRLIHTLSPVKQPLVLWAQGNIEFLNRPSVTMLGNQDPAQTPDQFVTELINTLEIEEIGLIGGYERGLDRSAFDTMLETRHGSTIAVLPMGLEAFFKMASKLASAAAAGRTLLVSPFAPDTVFQDKLAEARNILIDHLTLALLIPESNQQTLERAKSALERGLPVFVKADTAGNRELLNLGALLLTDPGEVVDWVQQALVDAAMQDEPNDTTVDEQLASTPLTATAPVEPNIFDDDYSLHTEDLPLINKEEAIELLSLGGEIPEILRKRLKNKGDALEFDS